MAMEDIDDSFSAGSPAPEDEAQTRTFQYQLQARGSWCNLQVPVRIPYTANSRELAIRLINSHQIPYHLEDGICEALEKFGREETTKYLDQQAEEHLYGGSVLVEGSEADQVVDKWVSSFTESCVEYLALDTKGGVANHFSDVYHKLIHSPALETLLQLEHTYSLAVMELCKARDNALELLQKRHDDDLSRAMSKLNVGGSEADINSTMRGHTLERETCERTWAKELSQLQESQRKEYRDWVLKVNEDLKEKRGGRGSSSGLARSLSGQVTTAPPGDDSVFGTEQTPPSLEESFTIHLGTQKKTMHNIRLLCGDPLDLCRHVTSHMHSPERLLTAMSLYSNKLSGLVIMVDDRINSLGGLKEAFAKVCHQSTDFHFQDIDVQLSKIQECAAARRDSGAAGLLDDTQTASAQKPPLEMNGWSHDGTRHAHSDSPTVSSQGQTSKLSEPISTSLEPGDLYLTRHSNLSSVHLVFHLVTEDLAILNSALKSRHPVVLGLKNALRSAARHNVHHVTIPLLLTHTMQPEMTINWCLKRAELIFKCVKGFMLENTTWGDGESRTIQFLVPRGISKELFEDICEMFPKIFRITSSRNLTARNSYK